LYPTYGNGNPQIAVNPSLAVSNFIGLNLAGIESLYDGSAGGTGYDLAWAQDANGNSVDLASADYISIQVQSGVLDLDAVSVVPEPATWALTSVGLCFLCFLSHRSLQRRRKGERGRLACCDRRPRRTHLHLLSHLRHPHHL